MAEAPNVFGAFFPMEEVKTAVENMADEQQNLLDERALAEATSDPAARIEALRREIEHHTYLRYPTARSTRSCASCASWRLPTLSS